MRIAKNSSKCFKDYVIQLKINEAVRCKKLIEVQPLLTFRVLISSILLDISGFKLIWFST